MKYCPKCGATCEDNSEFCSKCGNSLSEKRKQVKAGVERLFAAHLLNILSVLAPALFFAIGILLPDSSGSTTSGNSDGGLTVTFSLESLKVDPTATRVAMVIGFIIFIIGLFVYFLKSEKVKLILAYVYLFAAVADTILLAVDFPPFLIAASCGMLLIMFIPGILQIVAGVKFIKGAKEYAS